MTLSRSSMIGTPLASINDGLTEPYRLGFALHALGNVRAKQGRLQESFEAYEKALANFRATAGNHYFRTGQVCVKLAEHHANSAQPEAARYSITPSAHPGWQSLTMRSLYFEQALQIFEKDECYKPELARTLFKQAQFHESLRDIATSASTGHQLYAKATALYRELTSTQVGNAELTQQHFDRIVRFWSR